ncbi:tRNA preQ1(34) S-adenosylmethionine ribosyltransferase-isomerase QueA [Candidatus Parcubacteria bacterium]|nr:tRNA preQ1(34) S-adenosylmethionine ribosyltransferase-isomerase QueA [Candidatus Parcubacteria bacterium]
MRYELKDFDYNLPKNLIAQQPIKPRDHSRLLVLDLKRVAPEALRFRRNRSVSGATLEYKHFYDIVNYLEKGDVLVLNNSKVFPARLIGKKKETKGKIEVFLHRKIRGSLWQCLLGGHGRKEGLEIEFCCGLKCKVVEDNKDGTWDVKFNKSGEQMMKIVNKIGRTPLPPYIKRSEKRHSVSYRTQSVLTTDKINYQTVYADDKKIGSVAAPTAGFHFTPGLIKKLKAKGVQFEYITLHVGLGTFAPVKVDNIIKHKMHAEWVEVKKSVIERIIKAKREGRRIIAVGTTSVRVLESHPVAHKPLGGYMGWVNIFIYPPFKFKIIDAMITNFHLPKSTLLMLVSAFAGKYNINKAYEEAIKKKYRFYSYGDVMLII